MGMLSTDTIKFERKMYMKKFSFTKNHPHTSLVKNGYKRAFTLAEVPEQFPSPKVGEGLGVRSEKKIAFTLAEVLITLGVIGVVAAITMPTLIQNYKKKTWVEGLRVNISTIENGFKKLLADEGVDKLTDTSLWNTIPGGGCVIGRDCGDSFDNKLREYFKYEKFPAQTLPVKYLINNYSSSYYWGLSLPNNSSYYITFYKNYSGGTYPCFDAPENNVAIIYMDVNGIKKPNQFGRDVFFMFLTDNGRIILAGNNESWKCWAGCDTSYDNQVGIGCSGRIAEEGWKMNY